MFFTPLAFNCGYSKDIHAREGWFEGDYLIFSGMALLCEFTKLEFSRGGGGWRNLLMEIIL